MSTYTNTDLQQNRIHSIDVIRGFAILGIFLTNIISFYTPVLYINPSNWWQDQSDQFIYLLIDFFIQASFYPLFAILFGFGLVIMRERILTQNTPFTKISIRRLTFLLFIGCIHAFLVWHGDILITYALFGFCALLFLKLNGKILLYIGIFTYLIPNTLFSLLLLVFEMLSSEAMPRHSKAIQHSINVYQNGSFIEITIQRFHDWYWVNGLENLPFLIFAIFPLLLIGAAIAKFNWVTNQIPSKKKLTVLFLVFASVGATLKSLPFIVNNMFTEYVQDIFGGPLLGISYALAIILLMGKFSKWLQVFQGVGKLAMSNYLFQSLVSSFVFYSYGLGLYNRISIGTGTIIVLVIFAFQVYASKKWLNTFSYGPVEWLWRAFTYWKKPKWRKK